MIIQKLNVVCMYAGLGLLLCGCSGNKKSGSGNNPNHSHYRLCGSQWSEQDLNLYQSCFSLDVTLDKATSRIQKCIEQGANIWVKDYNGDTIVHQLASNLCEGLAEQISAAVFRYMVKQHPDIKKLLYKKNKQKKTPMRLAAEQGNFRFWDVVLEECPEVSVLPANKGKSLLKILKKARSLGPIGACRKTQNTVKKLKEREQQEREKRKNK